MGASSRGCCGTIAAAAVFCIVQSLLWIGLSIVALLLRNCSLVPGVTEAPYILIIVYFYNQDCAPDWATLNDTPATTKRTDIVTWYFLVTCALRVLVSAALLVKLVQVQRRGRGVSGSGPFFVAWMVLVVACLCGDVVCAILYGVDLGNVKSISDLLGVNVELPGSSHDYWGLSALPLVMLLFCIRLGILWIPEAVMLGISAKLFWKDRKEMKWLFGGNSTNTLASVSQSSASVPWIEGDGGGSGSAIFGGGADVVRYPAPSSQNTLNDYQEPSMTSTFETPYSLPADSTPEYGQVQPHDHHNGLRRANVPPPLHLRQEESGPPSPHRMGPWDPRSPFPPPVPQPTQSSFFAPQPVQQPVQQNVQQAPYTQAARAPPPTTQPPPPPPSQELSREGERRYKLKLKDHDAELRRREEAREAKEAERRRLQEQMLEEEERRLRDRALQELSQKAEHHRRRRAEAEVEAAVRKARPRPVPPPKPPVRDLQREKPWSYVLPPLDDIPGRRVSPAARGGRDAGYDDEEAPPVPVPDYTLRFKQPSDRPALGNR